VRVRRVTPQRRHTRFAAAQQAHARGGDDSSARASSLVQIYLQCVTVGTLPRALPALRPRASCRVRRAAMTVNPWVAGRAAAVGGVALYSKLGALLKAGGGGAKLKAAAAAAAAASAAAAAAAQPGGGAPPAPRKK
jgi:hypothetical protein